MTLSEIIKLKVDALFETYNNLNLVDNKSELTTIKERIEKVTTLIEVISKDIKNIKDLNYEDISDITFIKEEDLKNIQIVLKAKYEVNLPVELTKPQLEIINNLIKDLTEKRNLLIEKYNKEEELINKNKEKTEKLEDDILNLEILYERINDPDDYTLLNLEDFKILSIILEDEEISSKIKIELLSNIIEYNENIDKRNKKILSTTDIEEVKECFRSFGFKEDMLSYIDKNKEEISRNIDLNNAREILSYLQSKNIIDKFSKLSLLTIVLYSNANTVSKRYEDLKERKALFTSLFEMPSIWVNNLSKKLRSKHKKQLPTGGGRKDTSKLRNYANKISYEEMLSNEEYLTNLGLKVSISDKTNIKVLQTPSEKIAENVKVYKAYGFFKERDISTFPPSALSFYSVADRCDKLIEIGLLHNFDMNFALSYPSIIQAMREETFALLYKLKRENTKEDYRQIISSKSRKGTLNSCITNRSQNNNIVFGYDFGTKEKLEIFKQENFINQMDDKYIPNANEYEEIITKENPITYQDDILKDEKIKVLEEQYRVDNNPYQYKIGNEIISRLKVLRCYGVLKEKGITDDNAFLYAVTRGMYFDEKTFTILKSTVKGRGEYGWSI